MPTKTFFHLDENKRNKILEAGINEFSRAPFDEASIKNIVSGANIPRGSFYQYFKDKEDLYVYIFETIHSNKLTNIKKLLEENKGDLFKVCEILFLQEYEFFQDKKYHNLFKNFHTQARASMHEKVNKKRYMENMHHKDQELIELVNKDLYTDMGQESMAMLMRLLLISMRQVLINAGKKKINDQEALNNYKTILNLFKYGVLKTKKDDDL